MSSEASKSIILTAIFLLNNTDTAHTLTRTVVLKASKTVYRISVRRYNTLKKQLTITITRTKQRFSHIK
jgi:hypothetical protein